MNTPFEHRNFTVNEAAEYLRVGRGTIYRLVGQKKLALRKIGTRSIITGAELARFLEDADAS
jgi:excisionase family DNA binding protein